MASSRGENFDSFQEEFFNCAICSETFKDPKVLPCQHSFCKACIQECINKAERENVRRKPGFRCPLCRNFVEAINSFSPRKHWADDLPNDFRLQSMLESLDNLSGEFNSLSSNNSDTTSDYLDAKCAKSRPAKWMCRDHDCFVCENCSTCQQHLASCSLEPSFQINIDFNTLLHDLTERSLRLNKLVDACSDSTLKSKFRKLKFNVSKKRVQTTSISENDNIADSFLEVTWQNHIKKLPEKRNECVAILNDLHYQIQLARSVQDQPAVSNIFDSMSVMKEYFQTARPQLDEMEFVLNTNLFGDRLSCYAVTLNEVTLGPNVDEIEQNITIFTDKRLPGFQEKLTFSAKSAKDKFNCHITAAVVMFDNRILLLDAKNAKLKLFDENGLFLNEYFLLHVPIDVAETTAGCVLVTFGSKEVFQAYNVYKTSISHHTHVVFTGQPCFGISAGSELVFVACGNTWLQPSCIRVYDYDYHILKKIATGFLFFANAPYHVSFCPVSQLLYVSLLNAVLLPNASYLFCYDLDGNLLARVPQMGCQQIKGLVALSNGALTLARSQLPFLPSWCQPNFPSGLTHKYMHEGAGTWKSHHVASPRMKFAGAISSNRQRTMLLVTEEAAPFSDTKANNMVHLWKFNDMKPI